MKNIYLAVLFSFISLSAWSQVKDLDLYSGEKIRINVLDCGRNEQPLMNLDQKSGVVSVSCEPATCQAVSKSGQYIVYRYKSDECEWNGCNAKAKSVGSFKSKKSALKKTMTSFLKQSNECGTIRYFVSGFHGWMVVR